MKNSSSHWRGSVHPIQSPELFHEEVEKKVKPHRIYICKSCTNTSRTRRRKERASGFVLGFGSFWSKHELPAAPVMPSRAPGGAAGKELGLGGGGRHVVVARRRARRRNEPPGQHRRERPRAGAPAAASAPTPPPSLGRPPACAAAVHGHAIGRRCHVELLPRGSNVGRHRRRLRAAALYGRADDRTRRQRGEEKESHQEEQEQRPPRGGVSHHRQGLVGGGGSVRARMEEEAWAVGR